MRPTTFHLFNRAFLPAAVFVLLVSPAWAEGSIDGLFNEPDTESVDDAEGEEDTVDVGELTTAPLEVSGSVSAGIGAGLGLIEWPGSAAAGSRTAADLVRPSGFYSISSAVSVDARPEPYLRFYANVSTSLDEGVMDFPAPEVKELFIDYTLADTVFFRAGKQGLAWGQGRLLANPANLVSRVSDGVAFRTTVPAGPGTLGGVIYSIEDWVNRYAAIDPRAFGFAGQWEATLGPLSLAAMGHYHVDEPVDAAAGVSFGLGEVNVAVDGAYHIDQGDPISSASSWEALGQLFWEDEGRNWSILTEYWFDSSVADRQGHQAGIGIRMPDLWSDWRPAVSWKHAFQDHSGEVIAGIGGSIAPDLTMSIGLPVIYGKPGTFYRDALTETVTDENADEEEQRLTPVDNVVTLLLAIRLNFSL
ncbi:MAG: hypothetical protein K9L29_09915 [Spirochaetales bacterium]|nr:hypothetical protein [Spirochaetales bacterium]